MILISRIINVIVSGRVEDELSALRRFALYLNNKLTFLLLLYSDFYLNLVINKSITRERWVCCCTYEHVFKPEVLLKLTGEIFKETVPSHYFTENKQMKPGTADFCLSSCTLTVVTYLYEYTVKILLQVKVLHWKYVWKVQSGKCTWSIQSKST